MNQQDAKVFIECVFDKYVPMSGRSSYTYGEIARAYNKIEYRYWNDGDMIGVGYGNETCNAPARYLKATCSDAVSKIIDKMWGCRNETVYNSFMEKLQIAVAEDLMKNETSYRLEEATDMWEYQLDEDTDYDDEEEEELW